MSVGIAVALAGTLAFIGQRFGWLTVSGALAATLIGTVVLAGGGFAGATLLALFFLSASLLTYSGRRAHRGGRTARQVLANGTWAALGALGVALKNPLGWAALTGALAAAQSDTWATEIGLRSRRPPRLITTGQPVPAGRSGGVTALGTTAGAAGAIVMGAVAYSAGVPTMAAGFGALAGMSGMLADSLLGATLQRKYYCDSCERVTDTEHHGCAEGALPAGGWPWLDNDGVTLLSSGLGAVVAVGLTWWR